MSDLVEVSEPQNAVRLLQMNSPETRNALTIEMRKAISQSFQAATDDDSIKCIVLTGGETTFSAGADVSSIVDCGPMDVARAGVERYWLALKNCAKPIIAAVNGHAMGGGCELAMHADIIVAGESAVFGQPEVRLGIMPGSGATQRLPRVAGKYRAMKLLLTGASFTAQDALRMGLVSELVADTQVLDEAIQMAALIAGQPQDAVRKIKEVVLAGADASLDAGLLLERQAMQLLFDTKDQKDRMRAFLERRNSRPRKRP